MTHTPLGRSGLMIPPFTLGCCFFGSTIDDAESARIVDRALDAGINALDTAESYGMPAGASEAFLGRHLKGRRDRVVISTKVGPTRAWLKNPAEQGLTRRVIVGAVEASLRRLRTDNVDILYAHFPCPRTPLTESLGAFDALVKAGKVRYLGLSNHSASKVVEALWIADRHDYAPIVATQDLYNLFERVNEWDLYPVCQRHGLGVVAYAVLAGGLLSANYTMDMVRDHDRIPKTRRAAYYGRYDDDAAPTRSSPKLTENSVDAVTHLQAWAAEHGHTPTQVASAWALCHPAVTSILLGVSNCDQLDENLTVPKFTSKQRAEVGALFRRGTVNMVHATW